MSYILDALRRAERERTLGQIPGSETLSAVTGHHPRRDRRLIVLASATAVLAVAVAIALVIDRVGRNTAPAPAPPQPQSEQPAGTAGTSTPGDTRRPTPADEPPPVFEDDAGLASLDDIAPPFTVRPAVASAPLAGAATPAPASGAGSADIDVAGRTPEPPSSDPASPVHAGEAVAVSPSRPIESRTAMPHAPPLLRDMQPAFRSRFPALALQVHVYDDAPEKRWVMIDNRRYRESGTLESGPTIVEITPDGVIFELQGEQVLWPLVR